MTAYLRFLRISFACQVVGVIILALIADWLLVVLLVVFLAFEAWAIRAAGRRVAAEAETRRE